jgi:uncharacterized protein YecT (DUF1311 family)
MKKCMAAALLFVSSVVFGQTQLELNEMAYQSYSKADQELNLVYNQIRKKYADDPLILQKLRDAQRIWIQFRDASVDALFPYDDNRMRFGSMYPLLAAQFLERLTRDRIKQLRDFYLEEAYYN